MFGRTGLLKATALALPFSLAALAAHAASIAETVQKHEELTIFADAMEKANFREQLGGDGPYTVFAPTNEAFEQLPQGALDALLKPENRAQLTKLLEHHVVDGQALAAGDLLAEQKQIDTMAGETLTVDGTSQVLLLVPSTHATPVQDQAVGQAGARQEGMASVQQEQAARTPVDEQSGMPMTEHQQQALASEPAPDQQQTAPAGTADMPATPHQQQALESQPGEQQAQGQQGAEAQQQMSGAEQGEAQQEQAVRTPVDEQSDMPMTEHQQQALASEPAEGQQQTAPAGTADMPATQHQQEVIAGQTGQEPQGAGGQQQAQGQEAQEEQRTAAHTATSEGTDMPITQHQQEVLAADPGQEQRQTAPEGATPMPATEHQREALAEGELPGEQQQSYEEAAIQGEPALLREATVVTTDIQADNGVIHVIDAVLIPADVLETLEQTAQN